MDQTPPVPPPPETSLFEMDLDNLGQNHLNTISKWGKFISITLLIIVAIVVLLLATQYDRIIAWFSNLMALDNKAAGILIGAMVVFMGTALVVLFFLLRGCSQIKQGLLARNSDRIADGFKSLKVVFTIGIIISALTILSTLYSFFAV